MKFNRNPRTGNPLYNMIAVCVLSIAASLYFYFIRGDILGKIMALVVYPLIFAFAVYSFFHEKKDDMKAEVRKSEFKDDTYFNSAEWKEKYISYKLKHDFEKPKKNTMKKDLLSHCRKREDWLIAVTFSVLISLSSVDVFYKHGIIPAVGMGVLGIGFFIFYISLSSRAVRKWYTHDCDFEMLEKSYMNGKLLLYERNGLAFGTTHIHGFSKSKVYAIDYRLAENITRKIVRVKEYANSLYGKSRYEHFAVIHVRVPESGKIVTVSIELDEYQVQMAIDEFKRMKYTADKDNNVAYAETYTNDIVT